MARYKQQYTLFPRKVKSGTVYYYRVYDPETGIRTTAKSTGKSSKTAAKAYCQRLLKDGLLFPAKGEEKKIEDYLDNWFKADPDGTYVCPYSRRNRLARNTMELQRGYVENHIIPYFKGKRLKSITTKGIEDWIEFLIIDKGLSYKSAKNIFTTFKLIFTEAERIGDIHLNPFSRVKMPKKEQKPGHDQFPIKPKNRLTLEEARTILHPNNYSQMWHDDPIYYGINLVAAVTGARQGEILALQSTNIYPDHIHVYQSWARSYGLKNTKTGDERRIPIPSYVYDHLKSLTDINNGFVFSKNGGESPVNWKSITKFLYRAMKEAGITEEERKARKLKFHSWRHFYNSFLRSQGIPDAKVRSLTGHKTEAMMEHYTTFNSGDYQDVSQSIESILENS